MKVKRTTEMGPLSPATSGLRCDCFFDKVANGATSSQSCAGPGDCPSSTPSCNYGYCEQGG